MGRLECHAVQRNVAGRTAGCTQTGPCGAGAEKPALWRTVGAGEAAGRALLPQERHWPPVLLGVQGAPPTAHHGRAAFTPRSPGDCFVSRWNSSNMWHMDTGVYGPAARSQGRLAYLSALVSLSVKWVLDADLEEWCGRSCSLAGGPCPEGGCAHGTASAYGLQPGYQPGVPGEGREQAPPNPIQVLKPLLRLAPPGVESSSEVLVGQVRPVGWHAAPHGSAGARGEPRGQGPVGSLLAAGLSEDPRPWDSVPGSPGGRGPEDRSLQNLGEELVLWETGRGLAPREVAVSRWGGGSLKAPVAPLMLRSAVTADGTS